MEEHQEFEQQPVYPESGAPMQNAVPPAPGPAQAAPEMQQEPGQEYHSTWGDPVHTAPNQEAQPLQMPVKKQKKKKKHHNPLPVILTALVCLVIAVVACTTAIVVTQNHYRRQMALMEQAMDSRLGQMESQLAGQQGSGLGQAPVPGELMTPSQVYTASRDSVVCVECTVTVPDENGQTVTGTSSGSGFVITEDGYILTNWHVIEDAQDVNIRFTDGEVHTAQIVGSDSSVDVALLKIEAEGLPVAPLGSSDALAVGDQVVVVGYPLYNKQPILTAGYVSAKNQVINTDMTRSINTIQIDAAVNSGNSGGPVFNALGQVIGLAVAKESGTTSTGASIEGVSFAVPIGDALAILPDLKEFGYVKSGYLGVMVRDVDLSGQSYGLPAGAFVEEAVAGHAAAAGGVQARDIIVGIEGAKVEGVGDLTRNLLRYRAGDKIVLAVWRSGETVYLEVVLEEKPQEPEQPAPEEPSRSPWPDDFWAPIFP